MLTVVYCYIMTDVRHSCITCIVYLPLHCIIQKCSTTGSGDVCPTCVRESGYTRSISKKLAHIFECHKM